MAWVSIAGPPEADIVSLPAMLKFLRIPINPDGTRLFPDDRDDDLILSLISGARYQAEIYTHKSLAKKKYIQFLDSFPYFTDTLLSQMAYPPSYYALPRYATTQWNYSQMIKLYYPPLVDVEKIEVVGTDGTLGTLTPGQDFQVDFASEPARLFPLAGQSWPPVLYVANAVAIYFTAGYEVQSKLEPPDDPVQAIIDEPETMFVQAPVVPAQRFRYDIDRTVPAHVALAVKQLVTHWYQNRDPVIAMAGASGSFSSLPFHVEALLDSERFIDLAPTRG